MMTRDDYEHKKPSPTRFDLRRKDFDLHAVIEWPPREMITGKERIKSI